MIRQGGSREKKRRKKDNYVNKKENRPPASFPFLRFLRANTHDIQIAMRRLKRVVCVYERFFKGDPENQGTDKEIIFSFLKDDRIDRQTKNVLCLLH